MTKTSKLTAWDMIALESVVARAVKDGNLEEHSGKALLDKIQGARAITLHRYQDTDAKYIATGI